MHSLRWAEDPHYIKESAEIWHSIFSNLFEIVLCSSGDNQENVTEGAVLSSDSSPPLDSKGKVTQNAWVVQFQFL